MPLFIPCPAKGGVRCAASPASRTRPAPHAGGPVAPVEVVALHLDRPSVRTPHVEGHPVVILRERLEGMPEQRPDARKPGDPLAELSLENRLAEGVAARVPVRRLGGLD